MVDNSKYYSHSLRPGPPCPMNRVNTVPYLYSCQLLKSAFNPTTGSTYAAPATKRSTVLTLKNPDIIAIKILVVTPITMTLDVILARELHTRTGTIMSIITKRSKIARAR